MNLSKILASIGLVIEFLAVIIPIWRIFGSYESWKDKFISEKGEELRVTYRRQKKETSILLTLLFISIVLQIVALLPS